MLFLFSGRREAEDAVDGSSRAEKKSDLPLGMNMLLYLILGFVAGTLSGIFGIGGGVILIPSLVFLAGMTQHEAQGTTLAIMLLPIGLLAVMRYYQSGHVHLYVALFICVGFFIGGLLGANMAESLPNLVLRKSFGVFLLLVSLYTIFTK